MTQIKMIFSRTSGLVVVFAVLVNSISCIETDCISDDFMTEKGSTTDEARDIVNSGERDFSVNLIKSLFKDAENVGLQQNIFVSPSSIYETLLLAYFGAGGDTELELASVLGFDNDNSTTVSKDHIKKSYVFRRAFQEIREQNKNLGYTLINANKVFFDRALPLSQCMQMLLRNEIEAVDFKNAEKARQSINKWVEEKTLKKIKDLIPTGNIDDSTKAVMANAAYFKGSWKSKFEVENTKNDIFYVTSSNLRNTKFMTQKGRFNYYPSEELRAHVVEFPYEGDDISMMIILPPFDDHALSETIKRLTPTTLRGVMAEVRSGFYEVDDLNVELPKFKIEQSFDLSQTLSALGLQTLFDGSKSDLSQFLDPKNNSSRVTISSAVHKSFIDVNEEGSEAAAATALFGFRSARPLYHTDFIANHPFLFLIYDNKSDNILFFGAYIDPKFSK